MKKLLKLFFKITRRNTYIIKSYDSIPQIVFTLTSNKKTVFFNKVWFEYIGLHEEKSSPMLWKEYFHPEDLINFLNLHILNINLGKLECKCRILNKSGDYRWHLIRILPKTNMCFGTVTIS